MKNTRELSAEKFGAPAADGEQQFIVTEIHYFKDAKVRGYYLSVALESRKEEGNMIIRSFFITSCRRTRVIEAAARFSAKRLAEIVPPPLLVAELQLSVLREAEESARTKAQAR